MDGLQLGVDQPERDERRHRSRVEDVVFEALHGRADFLGRRRNVGGLGHETARRAKPVLVFSELAGRLVAAPDPGE